MALTNIEKVRLRVGDWTEQPYFPDTIYEEVLTDNSNNIVQSSAVMAQYILATLTRKTRSRLYQLENYSNQEFENYKQFLMLTISNPAFMPYSPIPFGGGTSVESDLITFQKYWNAGYVNGTSWDDMAIWYDGTVDGLDPL